MNLRTLGLALVLVGAFAGCPRTEAPEEEQTEQVPRSGADIRRVVNELRAQKGEDAYMDPSLDPLLVELEKLARAGDKDAATLRGLIIAKRRLALRAQSEEQRPPNPNLVHRGELVMEGTPPDSEERAARAEAIAIGSTRQELKDAYGSCLIRQTWYPATAPGGLTTELFHVAPECRKSLTPRIFLVAQGKVKDARPGTLDRVMEAGSDPAPGG